MTVSILYSHYILGIPIMYWIIMVASHLLHVFMKVQNDVQANKIAVKVYFKDKWRQASMVVALAESVILLIVGWDAYLKYTLKHPDVDLALYIGVAVAFIGYGGASLWGNLMTAIENKISKKINDGPNT